MSKHMNLFKHFTAYHTIWLTSTKFYSNITKYHQIFERRKQARLLIWTSLSTSSGAKTFRPHSIGRNPAQLPAVHGRYSRESSMSVHDQARLPKKRYFFLMLLEGNKWSGTDLCDSASSLNKTLGPMSRPIRGRYARNCTIPFVVKRETPNIS